MKKMIILLAVAGLVAGMAGFVVADDGPEVITLSGMSGDVTFTHRSHQERINDCKRCHHRGLESGKCTDCHGEDFDIADVMEAFHNQCVICHKKYGGPKECDECHTK